MANSNQYKILEMCSASISSPLSYVLVAWNGDSEQTWLIKREMVTLNGAGSKAGSRAGNTKSQYVLSTQFFLHPIQKLLALN